MATAHDSARMRLPHPPRFGHGGVWRLWAVSGGGRQGLQAGGFQVVRREREVLLDGVDHGAAALERTVRYVMQVAWVTMQR